jgi:hypothetical protein
MAKPPESWYELSDWCRDMMCDLGARWGIRPAPIEESTTDELDKAVDDWLVEFLHVANPVTQSPSPHVRPWVLTRFLFAAARCHMIAKAARLPFGNPQYALPIVLIGEWRERHKYRKQ